MIIYDPTLVELTSYIIIHSGSDLLPVHPSSFAHNFVSGVQILHSSESQDAIVLSTCH